MRPFILTLLLLPLTAGVALADDAADCTRRQVELAKQAAAFQGDAQIKRLIDADSQRARREQAEGTTMSASRPSTTRPSCLREAPDRPTQTSAAVAPTRLVSKGQPRLLVVAVASALVLHAGCLAALASLQGRSLPEPPSEGEVELVLAEPVPPPAPPEAVPSHEPTPDASPAPAGIGRPCPSRRRPL